MATQHPNPTKRTPTVSIHFASMTVAEITDRAHKLMQDGTALALLANALTEFEEATGRKLFVSEADQGTQYVGSPTPVEIRLQPDHGLTLPEVAAKVDTPAESNPVQEPIKNAAPANARPVPPKPTSAQNPKHGPSQLRPQVSRRQSTALGAR